MICAVVDTNGLPVHLALTQGEAQDNRLCSVLLSALLPQTMLLADRGMLSLAVSGYGCGRHFDAFTMPLGPAAVLAPRDPWRAMHAMEASAL